MFISTKPGLKTQLVVRAITTPDSRLWCGQLDEIGSLRITDRPFEVPPYARFVMFETRPNNPYAHA